MDFDMAKARELVTIKLKEKSSGEDWVVVDERTIEKPFGWVFFYNSRQFVESGNVIFKLAGNGPVIVDRVTGAVTFFGSADPLDEIIDAYQRPAGKRRADKRF